MCISHGSTSISHFILFSFQWIIIFQYNIFCWRRKWQPTQYSCLEKSMDRGAWQARVHGVAKSWTWLSHYHSLLSHIIFSYHYCIKIIVKMIFGLNYIFPNRIYIFFFLAVYWVSQESLVVKNPRDTGLIPGLWRSPEGGNVTPLQHSCLEIPWTEEPGLQSMGSKRVGHN